MRGRPLVWSEAFEDILLSEAYSIKQRRKVLSGKEHSFHLVIAKHTPGLSETFQVPKRRQVPI